MYGMVNKALEEMIFDRAGQAGWEAVKKESGIDVEVFITNHAYPDEITYKLVGAASHTLQMPADEVLHEFGRHWVLKTAQDGYGELMRTAGRTLPEFLKNLPSFHTRVSLIFPHLRPPRFRCADMTATSLRLHYYSDRVGLAAFVVGLVTGLGEMFGTPVRMSQEVVRGGQQADHDVVLVEWENQQA